MSEVPREEVLSALRGSVLKWKNIVSKVEIDLGAHNCPLCSLFFFDDNCVGCPVFMKTGRKRCHETPYDQWSSYLLDNGIESFDHDKRNMLERNWSSWKTC